MSNNKKIETAIHLIEIAETNIKNAKNLLSLLIGSPSLESKNYNPSSITTENITAPTTPRTGPNVMEGYFDGENMIGDDANVYSVPQNYASKSQLVIGDRLKWMINTNYFGESSEVFKLLMPVPKDRVVGKFIADNNTYSVMVNGYKNPIKILKASATYAMKNLNLKIGDNVAIYIPKIPSPAWGAFIGVYNQSTPVDDLPYQERKILKGEDYDDNFVIEDSEKSYF